MNNGTGLSQGIRGDAIGSAGSQYGVGGNAISANPSGTNTGVYGGASNGLTNYSIYGDNAGTGANDWAGYFNGKVNVVGSLITATMNVSNSLNANEVTVTTSVNATTVNVGTGGVAFQNGNSAKRAVKLKYIIAVGGTFPEQTGGTGQHSDALLGEVKMFAGNFAPDGWMSCEGQLLDIATFPVLFSLLGTTYGGDGRETFGLPDLREAVSVGY